MSNRKILEGVPLNNSARAGGGSQRESHDVMARPVRMDSARGASEKTDRKYRKQSLTGVGEISTINRMDGIRGIRKEVFRRNKHQSAEIVIVQA